MSNKRSNILFLTTRQWNPGDEFILKGVINLINTINPNYNRVIFNRHPEIHPNARILNPLRFLQKPVKGHTYWGPFFRVGAKDNSFVAHDNDPNIFALLVVAGTPGWANPASHSLYKYALANSIPAVFLGIGTPWENFSFENLRRESRGLLGKAMLITTRDARLAKELQPLGAMQVPCPALLSATYERRVERVDCLGFAIGHHSAYAQGISTQVYALLRHAIDHFKNYYKMKIICHFYDELAGLQDDFGRDCEVFYSYNSDDYFEAIAACDVVVGTRVHAIGAAASLGIPGVFVAHDQRADTVKGFLADITSPPEGVGAFIKLIDDCICEVQQRSDALAQHKRATLKVYQDRFMSSAELTRILE